MITIRWFVSGLAVRYVEFPLIVLFLLEPLFLSVAKSARLDCHLGDLCVVSHQFGVLRLVLPSEL